MVFAEEEETPTETNLQRQLKESMSREDRNRIFAELSRLRRRKEEQNIRKVSFESAKGEGMKQIWMWYTVGLGFVIA